MPDDYLWDRSGEPDPEVVQLEELLGRFRHDRPAPELPSPMPAPPLPARRALVWLASAAALLAAVLGGWLLLRERGSWQVASLEGTPRIGSVRLEGAGKLSVGQWLQTDSSSRARIDVGAIGEVEVEPNTRIGLVKARVTEHRLALERGEMSARIWAPPKLFFVDTPSAVAVDLGCAYTLKVDDTGVGRLVVTFGWVAFVRDGRESIVPAGAECITRPGLGPGTPYYTDASDAFRSALETLDFRSGGTAEVQVILAESRKKDSVTLWHLLPRVPEADRAAVYDKLASFVPPPEGASREAIQKLSRTALDLWRDKLNLPW
jgi:hypothetical protein